MKKECALGLIAAFALLPAIVQAQQLIGLSFSDYSTERWPRERDAMQKILLAGGFRVMAASADHSAARQREQMERMAAEGAKVIIVVAEDGYELVPLTEKLADQGIKAVAYDRLIPAPRLAAYISIDQREIGRDQARGILAAMGASPRGNVVLLGGSPTDRSSFRFRAGQMEVLQPYVDKGALMVVANEWVDNWDPANAKKLMEILIDRTRVKIDAVVASNDGTALGAIEALRKRGMAGKVIISGQDATEAGCNSIARGELTLTILKDTRGFSPVACDLAMRLAKGDPLSELPRCKMDVLMNDTSCSGEIPCKFLDICSVTKANLKRLVVDSGWQSYEGVYKGVENPPPR